MVNPKRFVLQLANYCQCEGCEKILKKLQEIDGVHSTFIDAKTKQLTILGPVDPEKVIKFLKKNDKRAKLITEEIQPKRSNHNMQITAVLPASFTEPVQEFNDQNLVALVQQLAGKGLKELEVTNSKTVKVTFNGKNKAVVSTQSHTRKKIVMDDDRYRGHGTGTSFGGPHLESATPWQGNYIFSSVGVVRKV